MNHSWSKNDDIVAFYTYKFGTDKIPYDEQGIALRNGIKFGSFKQRMANFQWLDIGTGLAHYAKQSKEIFDLYNSYSELDLRRKAFPELIK